MISRRFSKPSNPIGEGGCSGAEASVSLVSTVMVAEEIKASQNNRKKQQKQSERNLEDFCSENEQEIGSNQKYQDGFLTQFE